MPCQLDVPSGVEIVYFPFRDFTIGRSMSKQKKSPLSEKFANLVIFLCVLVATALLLPSKDDKWKRPPAPALKPVRAAPARSAVVAEKNSRHRQLANQTKQPAAPNFGTMIKNQASAAARTLRAELGDPAVRN